MDHIDFKDLNNKVCVLTGGAGVIGQAISIALAKSGVKTAILGRNEKKAVRFADQLQVDFEVVSKGYRADVTDKSALQAVKQQINDDLGKIDFLINIAGGNAPQATTQLEMLDKGNMDELEKSFFGLDEKGVSFVFDLNFKGTLLPTLVFSRDMLESQKGVVLNISSMAAYKPLTKVPVYSAAKAAINNFTQWLAVHFAKTGIRVNAMAPGFFLTDQNRFLLVDEKTGKPTARGQKIINNTPMERYGEVEELQGTVLYLLSDISTFVTGICIPVDGGFSAFGGI